MTKTEGNEHKRLGVFRRPTSAADRMPVSVPAGAPTPDGLNPGLARKAYTTPGGASYHVVPGADGLVALSDGGGCSVTSVDHIETGESVGWTMCGKGIKPDQFRISGMVPDGVRQVTVSFRDGKTKTVPVQDNVWAVEVKRKPVGVLPTTVDVAIAGTVKTVSLGVPDDIVDGDCIQELPPPDVQGKQ